MDDTKWQAKEGELAAIVIMLCAPSELNMAWARAADPKTPEVRLDVDRLLNDLSFSDEAKAEARAIMERAETMRARDQFAGVARVLVDSWGKEPHPSREVAKAIVAALRNAQVPA